MYKQSVFCDQINKTSLTIFDAIDRLSDIRDLLNDAYNYTNNCVIVRDDRYQNIIIVSSFIDRKIEGVSGKIFMLEDNLYKVIEEGLK